MAVMYTKPLLPNNPSYVDSSAPRSIHQENQKKS
jgi:hypothetical protein